MGQKHPSLEKLERELRDMLLQDAVAVFHGLYCEACGYGETSRAALSLAGWSERDFLDAAIEHLCPEVPGATPR